ncbi:MULTISPECIES: 2,3-butanediol dehydrogenase [unclassified Enterococcus]|uniref:2,3-butanediol dehydrogenase n=1 Tax=unclassified Enterococcus TaxID=2608891 RepID=UPI00155486E0|nr:MULTISPECIES: 2,3-butanediol dehydrogenase [unclassified Enterococcus]MBS7577440.1 2,3-butanediol dehydrogenase [Enterococcus sp. MMGLQ5-2]MBS7584847.1 2,3-butanediol dehydrogenase [Enterococcus sp. MMGLQ5-1]NPD12702.1 2,3-butanediol dehydrogenase [Enterococcus sp. MMGLQ5-1]NPD37274.1 2,3-butanediol dehydrogenase [Enterococcus sp. MMGLQ5-2]
MKAAVWHAKKDVRVEAVDIKPCGADEVRVKVAFTGMCGSDLHEYLEGPIFIPTDAPNQFTGKTAPIVMGHEFSGVVDQIGAEVENVKLGDRVAIYPTLSHEKKSEDVDIYDGYNFIGFARDGGFAEYCTLPATSVYQIPDNMSFEQGALVEPTAVAVQACKEGSVKFGDKVAIFGAGPIGCLITAAAKAAGAVEIIVCDLSEERLAKAKELGATTVLNSAKVNVVEMIRDLTHGGVDVAFEVAGVAITVQQSIAVTKSRGTMVIVSIFAHEISWDPMQLVNSGVKLTSTIAYSRTTFEQTIEAIGTGQLKVSPVITKKITLDEIVEAGFESLTIDKTQAKILVDLSIN